VGGLSGLQRRHPVLDDEVGFLTRPGRLAGEAREHRTVTSDFGRRLLVLDVAIPLEETEPVADYRECTTTERIEVVRDLGIEHKHDPIGRWIERVRDPVLLDNDPVPTHERGPGLHGEDEILSVPDTARVEEPVVTIDWDLTMHPIPALEALHKSALPRCAARIG
jgi:hypothetical protein